MAEKGDFNECEKCTSFQCTTCGLEASRGEGYVTERKSAFKCCLYMAICIIAGYILQSPPMSFKTMMFLLAFPIVGMYMVRQWQIPVVFIYLLQIAAVFIFFKFVIQIF